MEQKECKYCGQLFSPNRTDKSYCTDLCRYKYKYRKNLYNQAVKDKEEKIISTQEKLREKKSELKKFISESEAREKLKADQIKKEKGFKASFKKFLSLPRDKQVIFVFKALINKENDPVKKQDLEDELNYADDLYKFHVVDEYIKEKKKRLNEIKKSEKDRLFDFDWFTKKVTVEDFEAEIDKLEEEIEKLREFQPQIELPERRQQEKNKGGVNKLNIGKRKGREFNASQIRSMDFSSYRIPGELGSFLGELDDNKIAIALTGDTGAGKSYFSFELAKLFVDFGKSVKYFSLEEGIAKITKNKLDQFGIDRGIVFTDTGTLEDIDEDAERFEVIIIDSFGKISNRQQEFDLLRHKHPKTIFIIIFQKTTAKTIKGGAGIKYDSSATINVVAKPNKERVAIMEKCRYGTQNWVYSITQQRIISQG